LLALDEPLGALDALTRIEMQRLLEQVWLSNGFTAILVTHDVPEAVTLADRIVFDRPRHDRSGYSGGAAAVASAWLGRVRPRGNDDSRASSYADNLKPLTLQRC
jgi:ABC-type nitrate/sulfonate/bicarbonate transport system ATPase subunit